MGCGRWLGAEDLRVARAVRLSPRAIPERRREHQHNATTLKRRFFEFAQEQSNIGFAVHRLEETSMQEFTLNRRDLLLAVAGASFRDQRGAGGGGRPRHDHHHAAG